jgi:hypothetical protein
MGVTPRRLRWTVSEKRIAGIKGIGGIGIPVILQSAYYSAVMIVGSFVTGKFTELAT